MILLAILIATAAFIFFMKMDIRMTYLRKGIDNELIIILSTLFGLINIKGEVNLSEFSFNAKGFGTKAKGEIEAGRKGMLIMETGKSSGYEDTLRVMTTTIKKIRTYKNAGRYLMKRSIIRYLYWDTCIGTGDAALTGLTTGLLWNVKTFIVYILNLNFEFGRPPILSIKPNFDNITFSTKLDCILTFKIGHAIIAGIKGLIAKIRDGD